MEFGPDGAFAVDLRDDAAADAFLKANELEEGQVPLLHPAAAHSRPTGRSEKKSPFDEKKHARNEEMKEHDHAPLRAGDRRRRAADTT